MELFINEILIKLAELAKTTNNPYTYVFLIICVICIKYRKEIGSFFKNNINLSIIKNSEEHSEFRNSNLNLLARIELILEAVNETKEDIREIREEQKSLNYRFTVSIENGTAMKKKLLKAMDLIIFKGDSEIDLAFKTLTEEMAEVTSEIYTELRSKNKDLIDFTTKERMLERLRFIFEKNKINDHIKLDKIIAKANLLLNEFNITKKDKGNSDLITQIYGSFIKSIYSILTNKD